jgi:hypothetical protein
MAGRRLPSARPQAPRGLSARALSTGGKGALPASRSVTPPRGLSARALVRGGAPLPARRALTPPRGLSARALVSGGGPLPSSRSVSPPRGLSARALSSGTGPLPANRGLAPPRGLSVRALTSGGSAARVLGPAGQLGGLRLGRVPTRGFAGGHRLRWPLHRRKGFSGRVAAPRRFGFGGRVPHRQLGFSRWRRLWPDWARRARRRGSWRAPGGGTGGGTP